MGTPTPSPDRAERTVLVLAPTGRDGPLASAVLREAGLGAVHCLDGEGLAHRAEAGLGAIVLTEEVAATDAMDPLERLVGGQPPWSDVPVIVLASNEPTSLAGRELMDRLRPLGNITILERPVHRSTLVSAVQSALRARERQYQVRDLLAEHERSVRLRDQFLAMLGHELRNPLGAIRNTLHTIDLGEGATDRPALIRPRDLSLISRQVALLTRLVDDLLDVSRVTSGKIVLKRGRIDLVDLVFRCVQSLEANARLHGLAVDLAADSASLAVEADPTRLEQVFINLLTNAIKYTPPEGRIGVRTLQVGQEAVVTVSDTGTGLSADMLERVFDLFSQSHRTLERAEGGLGIGLTLVRALVRQHGGTVTARSAGPGHGSTFEVRLPLASRPLGPGPAHRPTGASIRRPAAGVPLRILVVEDSADNRESLILLLEALGHEAVGAPDGPEALRRLESGTPDLAFVDIGLPGMDGYEVARRTRAAVGNRVFLVALSGYGQPEDRERSRDAGFDDHVAKPMELPALDAVLERVALLRS